MNAEAEAEAEVNGVSVEDTPLPLPPDDDALALALALALAVLENPPSVDRDAESADVDSLRSALALALGLALLVIEVEVKVVVEKRPVALSSLLEITAADAETLWLGPADAEKLTGPLGTEGVADEVAVLIFDNAAEAETEADGEAETVGTPPAFPNAADADADAEVTALSAPDSNATEAVETVELAAAFVEVEDSAALEAVDCAALGRILVLALALCCPGCKLGLELDEANDSPEVVVVFAFAVVAEAEAVTDSAPDAPVAVALRVVPPTASADVVRAAEDDFSEDLLVEAEDVVVGMDDVVDERVVKLANVFALLSSRAVLKSKPDLLDSAAVDAEKEELVDPPAALELDISVSVSVSTAVFDTDTDAVAVVECAKPDALFSVQTRTK